MSFVSTTHPANFPQLDLTAHRSWKKLVRSIRFLPLAYSVIEAKALKPKFTFHLLDCGERFIGVSGDSVCYSADARELEAVCKLAVRIEDKRFFLHRGVDLVAIVRSIFKNLSALRIVQGGSTITQQLVRNTLLIADRSLTRKFVEILLARKMERHYSKREILSLYAQFVYLGNGIRGFAAASKAIYRRPIFALDHQQVCGLVGLLRQPSTTHPLSNAAKYLDRQAFLIGLSQEPTQTAEDDRERIRKLLPSPNPINVSAFRKGRWATVVERTHQKVLNEHTDSNIARVGLTIDQPLQRIVDGVLKEISRDSEVAQVAAVLLNNRTSDILIESAWQNGVETAFSPTFFGRIQPGSTFKTVAYLAALESGVSPDTLLESRPFESSFLKNGSGSYWCVRNYADTYYGTVTLTEALRRSDNSAFARLAEMIPSETLDAVYRRFGLCPERGVTPAIVLGGSSQGVPLLSLVSAYAAIARGGVRIRPRFVRFVQYSDGSVLHIPAKREDTLVIHDNSILFQLKAALRGAGEVISSARFSGKTGTTKKGSVFVGYNEEVSLAVWVGYRGPQSEHHHKSITAVRAVERIVQKLLGYRQDLFTV